MTQDSTHVEMASDLLTPKEAAAYLRVPVKSIYNRVQRKELGHIKLGRLLRFKRSELDRVLTEKKAVTFETCDPATGKAS